MPASIEAFVRRRAPQAKRVELCHTQERIVVRRGWEPLGASCEPKEGDEPDGLSPTRYGDWVKKGIAIDF